MFLHLHNVCYVIYMHMMNVYIMLYVYMYMMNVYIHTHIYVYVYVERERERERGREGEREREKAQMVAYYVWFGAGGWLGVSHDVCWECVRRILFFVRGRIPCIPP